MKAFILMSYQKFFKPFLDYFFSIISVFLLSPIFILTAILIRVESKGPVLYVQERLGKNGRIFNLYKFRSMIHQTRDVSLQVFDDNSEITSVGKILRRFKIDELPQLFNVILGDMSLVGPRPSLPNLRENFNNDGEIRIKVKPGCANLATVNGGIYLSWPERWVFDRYYIEHLTFFLDMKIICKTIIVVFLGERFFFKK